MLEKWFLLLYNYVPIQAYPGQTTKNSISPPQFCPLASHGPLAVLEGSWVIGFNGSGPRVWRNSCRNEIYGRDGFRQ